MKKQSLLAAAFGLALAFTLSCSNDKDEGCISTSTHYCYNGTGTLKEYGYMTDGAGKKYKTVEIGSQTWMAENLNYKLKSSNGYVYGGKCCNDKEYNCTLYGSIYDGWDAMEEACPAGWHLPTNAEWMQLADFVGGSVAKLRARSGWEKSYVDLPGTDDYGFAALPNACMVGDSESLLGSIGQWWTASNDYGHDNDPN